MKPVALFITYTMSKPIVAGAFFRALRLAGELANRGFRPVIFNSGPALQDPKIDQARDRVEFIYQAVGSGLDARAARRRFLALDPAVIIMGEGPFEAMRPFYDGARQAGRPFVVLDQYYNDWLMPDSEGVDLILQYGLRSFWPGLKLKRPYRLTPPFIERVTPEEELPVPDPGSGRPWVTFLSYEETVLRAGVDLLAALGEDEAAAVVISRTPGEATDLLRAAGLDLDKILVLPPQSDADLFGLIGAGRVALVSNGFLQIMDALALGRPVIALARGHGVGMTDLNIAEQFYPYVSFGASQAEQVARLRGWLSTSPFSPALMAALARERGGIVYSADEIEALVCCGSVAIRGASGREHPA